MMVVVQSKMKDVERNEYDAVLIVVSDLDASLTAVRTQPLL